MFGNTEKIASAIAEGLGDGATVDVITPDELSNADLRGIDLLVVGAPTHGHGVPRRETREQAKDMTGYVGRDPRVGVREFLEELPDGAGTLAAAFDTRMPQPMFLTGSAAKGIHRRLLKHGYEIASEPASFIVEHADGPLREGELERAKRWGQSLLIAHRSTGVA
jgi:flavodoxin